MSLFAELKRRNVFRVGIAYAIAAWIVLQVADVIGEIMELPEWGGKLILLLLIVGFIPALIFAWAFELTPGGLKREKDVDRSDSITPQTGRKLNNAILVLMALAIAYLLYDKFSGTRPDSVSTPAAEVAQSAARPETEPAPGSDIQVSRQSIAVLPFDNRSNREEDQFFTDGIHDDLLTTIARIGSMKVISRTSVMEYKGTTKKIPQIAAELGVAHILEGGIQRSGNQVRINVQLIDAQTDEHLWAEIFDRELTAENLFAIQSEISTKIAEALQTTLSPEERRGISRMPTQNLEAYEAYMRGKLLLATRRIADLKEALEEFETAVKLDPEFGLAWVGVADSHDLIANYSDVAEQDTIEPRKQAVQRALAIDPGLGEAYASLGAIHADLYENEASEAAFKKAIELSPNYATAYQWYGNSLIADETRSRERLALAYQAVELDPRSLIIGANLANEFLVQGMFSQFEQQIRKQIELDPRFPNSYHQLLDYQLWTTGELAKALANARKLYEIDPANPDSLRHQIEVFVEIGDREAAAAAQEKLQELNPEHYWASWSDLHFALRSGNAPAVREAINWILPRRQGSRGILRMMGHYTLTLGDVQAARELLLQAEPDWLDPEAWDTRIVNDMYGGCIHAWVLMATGEEELGRRLLEKARDFQENQRPATMEHADRYSPELCYLAGGDAEKALASLEMQLAHGHTFQWDIWHRMPLYDSIRHEPRYQALLAAREKAIERQKDMIAAMGEEAGP
jgi:TolB-like protein/Tfp pilus assembly protein PilF